VDGSELPRTYSIEADVRGAKIHVNQPKIGGREIVVVLRSGEEVIIPDEGQ
jgi:hypothetical protein